MLLRFFGVLLFALLGLSNESLAQADEDLGRIKTFELSKDHIDITVGFNGADLDVFGVKEQAGDVIVQIIGPSKVMKVRKKEQLYGAWVNRFYVLYDDIPSFYAIASNRAIGEIAEDETLNELGIGAKNIGFHIMNKNVAEDQHGFYEEALVRNKRKAHLLSSFAEEVRIFDGRFFKTSFMLPHNLPIGEYHVYAYYFNDGIMQDKKERILKVAQVGIIAQIKEFAAQHKIIYGLICVMMAMSAGWVSNKLRRL
jgi:uncharacterized protein (TIGR02186 family)